MQRNDANSLHYCIEKPRYAGTVENLQDRHHARHPCFIPQRGLAADLRRPVCLAFFACGFALSVVWFFAWRLLSAIAADAIVVALALELGMIVLNRRPLDTVPTHTLIAAGTLK